VNTRIDDCKEPEQNRTLETKVFLIYNN